MNKWFPELHSVVAVRNPSWINSAWLGLVLPVIYLWEMLWVAIAVPTLTFVAVIVMRTGQLTYAIISTVFSGLTGRLSVVEEVSDNVGA